MYLSSPKPGDLATATLESPTVTTNTSHRDRGVLGNSEHCTGTTLTSEAELRRSAPSAITSQQEDSAYEQPNGGLPQRTNPTYQIPPRNQNVADGRGQLGARAAHHAAPRNAPLQTAPNPPPSWGASAYDQWGQAHVDDWGGPSRNSNNAHNGHMAVLNWQANGFAPNFPQANVGASGSSLVDNTYAANAASQPPQNSRSNFPVSRYAPPLRRNGFGDYRGPTMRVLRKNGVDKLVRDG
ncbi:hypothetical protein AAVH_08012 [Aphelenchoides avenae]|nr:hypothetical protein AAVH_08012 [Aphelenchus avenae]